jgi:hypothetical protein
MNLKIRDIRRALINVVEAPKSTYNVTEMMLDIIEVITIMKSNKFPLSLK